MADRDEHPKERSTDTFLQQLLAADANEAVALERGAEVGRYVVIELLGAGGMSMVYRAFDPTLDRSVALKVMQVDPTSPDRSAASQRLLGEAQALAKLSHPNVIAVHDVGVVGDDVFVAMEYVPGATLTQWCADRGVDAIVEAFAAAGDGLAAAHAAGLIHRDFKPDNVIVGDDGRVRVLDFGLARAPSAPAVDSDSDGAVAAARARRHVTGKSTAGVIGTPAYMAPEQHTAGAVDERSDQFSFCAALYEALYGHLPFAGDTVDELEREVVAGNVVPAPVDSSVPGWLREVLLRGLAVEPDQRWPSMQALVGQLVRTRRSPGRIVAIVAVVAVAALALAAVGVWYGRRNTADPCASAGGPVARVWNDEVETRVHEAFTATGRPDAEAAFARVRMVLAGYAAAWTDMRVELCRAGPGSTERDIEILALRAACLDERLAAMTALVDRFAAASDASVVINAVHDAFELEGVGRCADTEALLAARPAVRDAPDPTGCGRVEPTRFNPLEVGRVWVYDVIDKSTRIPAGDPKVVSVEAFDRIGGCKGDRRAYRIRRQMTSGYAYRWQEARSVDSPDGYPAGDVSLRHRDQWFSDDGTPTKDEYFVPARIRIDESCAGARLGSSYLDSYDEVEVEVSTDPDECAAEIKRKTRTFDWKVINEHEPVELALDYSHAVCCPGAESAACAPPPDGPGHRCTRRDGAVWDCVFDTIAVQRREVQGGKEAVYWFAPGVGKVKEDTKGDVEENLVCFGVP